MPFTQQRKCGHVMRFSDAIAGLRNGSKMTLRRREISGCRRGATRLRAAAFRLHQGHGSPGRDQHGGSENGRFSKRASRWGRTLSPPRNSLGDVPNSFRTPVDALRWKRKLAKVRRWVPSSKTAKRTGEILAIDAPGRDPMSRESFGSKGPTRTPRMRSNEPSIFMARPGTESWQACQLRLRAHAF